MNGQSLKIVGAGLLGLIVAACLGYLALQLVSQPVGLSTVDASAGDELVATRKKHKPAVKKKPKKPVITTPYVPPQTSNDSDISGSGGDDSGGDDSGGDDHGGDDDD
ncbi:MAG: hypothetical protein ACSLFF_06765 [Solirubrobacterales bacterium]